MVICLAITSRDQIVNMNDVYKFYGKDKGIINTEDIIDNKNVINTEGIIDNKSVIYHID